MARRSSIFNIALEDEVVDNANTGSLDTGANNPGSLDVGDGEKERSVQEYDAFEAIEYSDNNNGLRDDITEATGLATEAEELEVVGDEMQSSVDDKEELVFHSPEVISEDNVALAQEEFAYYLGRLSNSTSFKDKYTLQYLEKNRVSIEADGTPVQMYMVSIEGFKEVVQAVVETVANIIAKVMNMITKMRAKMTAVFGNYSKQAQSLINKLSEDNTMVVVKKENLSKIDQSGRDVIKNTMGPYAKIFGNFAEDDVNKMALFSYSNVSLTILQGLVERGKFITAAVKNPKDDKAKAESLVEMMFYYILKKLQNGDSIWSKIKASPAMGHLVRSIGISLKNILKGAWGIVTSIFSGADKYAGAPDGTPDTKQTIANEKEQHEQRKEARSEALATAKNDAVVMVATGPNGIVPYADVMSGIKEATLTTSANTESLVAVQIVVGIDNNKLTYFEMSIPKDKSERITASKLIFKTGTVEISQTDMSDSDVYAVEKLNGDKKVLLKLLGLVADKSKGVEAYYNSINTTLGDIDKIMKEVKSMHLGKEQDAAWSENLALRNAYSSYLRGLRSGGSSLLLASIKEYVNFSKKAIQFANIVAVSQDKLTSDNTDKSTQTA